MQFISFPIKYLLWKKKRHSSQIMYWFVSSNIFLFVLLVICISSTPSSMVVLSYLICFCLKYRKTKLCSDFDSFVMKVFELSMCIWKQDF